MLENMKVILLSLMGAYGVGALPAGFLIARLAGIDDITRRGSGNIGATNVGRFLGTKFFVLVFFLDSCKAFLYMQLLAALFVDYPTQLLAASMLLIGNGFSIFLAGRGGKGVATAAGILCALVPRVAGGAFFIWLVAFAMTHTVGVASSIALLLLPAIQACLCEFNLYTMTFIMFVSAWGLYRHKDNIKRYVIA